MGLPVGPVQVQEGPCKGRCIRCGKAQVGDRRRSGRENRIGQRLAHVSDKALAFANGEFGHVQSELLRQRQNHGGRNRPMIVLHLVEVGKGNRELIGKDLLRQAQPPANLAQLDAGI